MNDDVVVNRVTVDALLSSLPTEDADRQTERATIIAEHALAGLLEAERNQGLDGEALLAAFIALSRHLADTGGWTPAELAEIVRENVGDELARNRVTEDGEATE